MLSRIDLRDRDLTARELLDVVPRADLDVSHALEVVTPIIADVRERGADALREYATRFDGVEPRAHSCPRRAHRGGACIAGPRRPRRDS
ncbi:hypothetical protein GCM10025876_34000 [Demequina litorisediminis]|uniref:Histidinol dehydrogenase n=1 Tax=Demequina litorisediminis TaxID=1849022 RepID=A0ABQ6IHK6_9MICO|nr:hypothetical protein GCM10025876_34000 [Demequina litorisediminis]